MSQPDQEPIAQDDSATPASTDPDCLFCKIVDHEIPADIVLETEHAVVFRDLQPQAPTHLLAIPRRHEPNLAALAEADPGTTAGLFAALAQVARDPEVREGYRLVANTGAKAHQTVFHAHVHLLGGRTMTWPPG